MASGPTTRTGSSIPTQHAGYPFDRFEKDWSATSPDNDYGQIHSHRIAATRMIGNVLQTGTFVNGRKSKAINLDYDPKDHTLNFSPEDVQFSRGPGGFRKEIDRAYLKTA